MKPTVPILAFPKWVLWTLPLLASGCLAQQELLPVKGTDATASMSVDPGVPLVEIQRSLVSYDATKSFTVSLPPICRAAPVTSPATQSAAGCVEYYAPVASPYYLPTDAAHATLVAWREPTDLPALQSFSAQQGSSQGRCVWLNKAQAACFFSSSLSGWLEGQASGLVSLTLNDGWMFQVIRTVEAKESRTLVEFSSTWRVLEEDAQARKTATVSLDVAVHGKDAQPISHLAGSNFLVTASPIYPSYDYTGRPTIPEVFPVVSCVEQASGSYHLVTRTHGSFSGDRSLAVQVISPGSIVTL